jgi:hypothetical protein
MDRHGSNFGLINILLLILLYKYIVFPFLYSSRPLETLKLFSYLLDLAGGGGPPKKINIYRTYILLSPPGNQLSIRSGTPVPAGRIRHL